MPNGFAKGYGKPKTTKPPRTLKWRPPTPAEADRLGWTEADRLRVASHDKAKGTGRP